jgi:hypothetical protein
MKRGLIHWDAAQLPPAAFAARLANIHHHCERLDVPALAAYCDVWRSNDVRYISNYMPYWNRALTIVPRGEKPLLLCSLSPRVYPWIKSVTIHEVVIASPSLPAQLAKLCEERGWTRLGMLDVKGLPHDLYTQISAGSVRMVDLPRDQFHVTPDSAELDMYRHAARDARHVLERQLTSRVVGLRDHEVVGELEREFRRAGAEDLVVLVSDGRSVPLPPSGKEFGPDSSVCVALERNGHWVKISRNVAGLSAPLSLADPRTTRIEKLSGPYSWECINSPEEGALVALQVEINRSGDRLFFGDTGVHHHGRLELL